MLRCLLSLSLLLALSLSMGCAPSLKLKRLQPAKVSLGDSRRLSVVQFKGDPKARELLVAELLRQATERKYFQIQDRLEGPRALEPDEIGLVLDVWVWNVEKVSEVVEVANQAGKVVGKMKADFFNALVVVSVTALDDLGTVVTRREFRVMYRSGKGAGDALRSVSARTIAMLLSDITPAELIDTVRLDDDDEALLPSIELARQGQLDAALRQTEHYALANPDSAPAFYNLAVFYDAAGDYKRALELYERAIALSLNPKDYYLRMKEQCEDRLIAQPAPAK